MRDLEDRISSIESLLCRAGFDDFQAIDELVKQAQSGSHTAYENSSNDERMEPEKELTPVDVNGSTETVHFNIFEEKADAATQTHELPHRSAQQSVAGKLSKEHLPRRSPELLNSNFGRRRCFRASGDEEL